MQASGIPTKFDVVWAVGAAAPQIRPIPDTSGDPNAASFTLGFPPNTFAPLATGGANPDGRDFNGILKQVTAWLQWNANAGVPAAFDGGFSAAVGGYPKGAVVSSGTFPGLSYLSTADNNTSNPDSGGSNWLGASIGFSNEATLASASTVNLGSQASHATKITGTAAITSFGSSASVAAPIYAIRFAGACTLTYNATSMILPTAASIAVAVGDWALAEYLGSGNWQVVAYQRADGTALSASRPANLPWAVVYDADFNTRTIDGGMPTQGLIQFFQGADGPFVMTLDASSLVVGNTALQLTATNTTVVSTNNVFINGLGTNQTFYSNAVPQGVWGSPVTYGRTLPVAAGSTHYGLGFLAFSSTQIVCCWSFFDGSNYILDTAVFNPVTRVLGTVTTRSSATIHSFLNPSIFPTPTGFIILAGSLAIAGTVSGSTISFGAPATVGAALAGFQSVALSASTFVAIQPYASGTATGVTAYVVTVSGTSITVGTGVNYVIGTSGAYTSQINGMLAVSGTAAILEFSTYNGATLIIDTTLVITVSGTVPTLTLQGSAPNSNLWFIKSGSQFLAYSAAPPLTAGGAYTSHFYAFTVSGTAATFSAGQTVASGAFASQPNPFQGVVTVAPYGAGSFVAAVFGVTFSNNGVVAISVSGTTLVIGTPVSAAAAFVVMALGDGTWSYSAGVSTTIFTVSGSSIVAGATVAEPGVGAPFSSHVLFDGTYVLGGQPFGYPAPGGTFDLGSWTVSSLALNINGGPDSGYITAAPLNSAGDHITLGGIFTQYA